MSVPDLIEDIYKPAQYPTVKRLFADLFGVGVHRFTDNVLTVAFARVHIDVVKFDDWLHEQHGDYEAQGHSMASLVKEKYGADALKLLEKII